MTNIRRIIVSMDYCRPSLVNIYGWHYGVVSEIIRGRRPATPLAPALNRCMKRYDTHHQRGHCSSIKAAVAHISFHARKRHTFTHTHAHTQPILIVYIFATFHHSSNILASVSSHML